jgi:hypothetical protein
MRDKGPTMKMDKLGFVKLCGGNIRVEEKPVEGKICHWWE